MADVNPKFPLVQFPFATGIDESQRAEVVEAGSGWLVLENGRQDQRGGYATRNGFTALTSGRMDATTATSAYKLFSDNRGPVRISDLLQVETYSPQAAAWRQLSRVCEADYRTIELPTIGTTVEDVEYCNGYLCVTTQNTTGAGYMFLDAQTLATVMAPFTGTGTIRPLVASYGSRYFAILNVTATTIQIAFFDMQSVATIAAGGASFNVTTTTYANKAVSICSLGDRIAVAWINNSAGTDRVSVNTYDVTGLLQSTTVNTSSVTPAGVDIACYGGTGTLWVAWNETTATKMKGLTYNSLSTVLATTATIMTTSLGTELVSISPASATAGQIICNDGDVVDVRTHWRGYTTTAGAAATVGTQQTAYSVNHCSRPFYLNGRHYVQMFGGATSYAVDVGNTQKNLVLVDWTYSSNVAFVRPVVNLTPELAVNAFYGKCKTVVSGTATTLYGVAGVSRSSQANGINLIEYDFASMRRWQTATFGNSTFLSGGILSSFDGARAAEVGFMHRPKTPLFVSAAGVGTINGSYRYVLAYEDVDADGNWCISGLSSPSATVNPVNNLTVTMTGTPISITQRSSANGTSTTMQIAWYRTLAGAVAPYYRVGTSFNTPGSATVTFADTMTDAVLATKAKLYAQPGVIGTAQDRRPPPGLGLVISYNGMLVGATGSDVSYSGQNVSGEGAWFNPLFQVPVPGAGDITALAVMDGGLFVFKRSDVYAITGEPSSDNAAAGGLGLPRRLAVDVGAISPVTCTTAFGVIFRSDRGIEILTRAQTVDWIGEAVQVTAAAYPILTSITVNPATNVVLVEVAASSSAGLVTGAGRTLVYDLSLRAWVSADRRTSSAGTADAPSQSACMIYSGSSWVYAWVTATGVVHTENSASSLEANGSMTVKRAISASVKGSGILGSQFINRTQLLAKRNDVHDLTMSFAYDYSDSFTDTRTWTNAELAAFTIPNQQLEHTMGVDADCEAVRIQLLDVTPSTGALTTGRSATWIGLCFEVVPKAGAYLLPDTSR